MQRHERSNGVARTASQKWPDACNVFRNLFQFQRFPPESGGAEGDRTPDLLIANEALSQLSYGPPPGATGDEPSGCARMGEEAAI
jgi:hypothetical protein